MPTSFYTRKGDDGTTGILGKGRVAKSDLRMEAIGSVDEITSALGMARAFCRSTETRDIVLRVQRDLYGVMAELAATAETVERFRTIGDTQVTWLEEQTDRLSGLVTLPLEFILPGDSPASAAIDLARTVTRRAERRTVELAERGDVSNPALLRYLNRLSSLCYVLELREIQLAGSDHPTLAKGLINP